MVISVPKETKSLEFRVALTPASVHSLVSMGHQVYVQSQAGIGSGFSDQDYLNAGASMTQSLQEAYQKGDMVIKVKEPLEEEYQWIREGQVVFTFFHFSSSKQLLDAMMAQKGICIAYETVEQANGQLPLLIPMSEIAGRMATQQGAKYLEHSMGGKGILLGGVPGVPPAQVLVIGGGVVGTEAAKMAAGLGADVTILDKNLQRLRYLSQCMPSNVKPVMMQPYALPKLLASHILIIGAVLITGAKAPRIITKEMLKSMSKGTVLIDVAVDQGGCFETTTPTTHDAPTYIIDGILHYCVQNMPGVVPYTSSVALNNASLPYIITLAQQGWRKAAKTHPEIKKGINLIGGKVVYKAIAEDFSLPYTPIDKVL